MTIKITPSTRMGVAGNWEDPFLWQDVTGMWHILSHTYVTHSTTLFWDFKTCRFAFWLQRAIFGESSV